MNNKLMAVQPQFMSKLLTDVETYKKLVDEFVNDYTQMYVVYAVIFVLVHWFPWRSLNEISLSFLLDISMMCKATNLFVYDAHLLAASSVNIYVRKIGKNHSSKPNVTITTLFDISIVYWGLK